MAKKLAFVVLALFVCAAPVAAQTGNISVKARCGDTIAIKVACDQAAPVIAQMPNSPAPTASGTTATPTATTITVKPGNAAIRVDQALKAANCHPSTLASVLRANKLEPDSTIKKTTAMVVPVACSANADEQTAAFSVYGLRAEKSRVNLRANLADMTKNRDYWYGQAGTLSKTNAKLTEDNGVLKAEVTRLRGLLNAAGKTIDNLQAQVVELKKSLGNAQFWRNILGAALLLAVVVLAILAFRARRRNEEPTPEEPARPEEPTDRAPFAARPTGGDPTPTTRVVRPPTDDFRR